MQVIAVRVGALGYWPTLVLYAVRTGFAGALSTVSTYIAEARTRCLGSYTQPHLTTARVWTQLASVE